MSFKITHTPERKLIGYAVEMSFAENKTASLWQKLMPVRNDIQFRKNNELISLAE